MTIKVTAAHAGTATNTAKVTSAYLDTNAANNSASVTVTIGLPKLKLKASPRTGHAGQQLCVSFTATSRGKPVKGAKVSFAHHSATTSGKGKARLCVTLRKSGVYHAHASKKNYVGASATIHISGASTPSFTG